jgi:hyperosmotically inducible periplasmic protein
LVCLLLIVRFMKHLGVLLFGSIAALACASNNPPPAASSATVVQATNEPNRGPEFAPASSDGVATAETDAHRVGTRPTPVLDAPTDGAEGASSVDSATRNAAGTPSERTANEGADNTRVNERDRGDKTLTPMDQGPSESDRRITQQIRQQIMKSNTLSFTAKNVKIITQDGRVTLRGPVKTEAERTTIEAAARRAVGSGGQVDSQLELSK